MGIQILKGKVFANHPTIYFSYLRKNLGFYVCSLLLRDDKATQRGGSSVCQSVRLHIHRSVHSLVRLSIRLSTRLSIHRSIRPSTSKLFRFFSFSLVLFILSLGAVRRTK